MDLYCKAFNRSVLSVCVCMMIHLSNNYNCTGIETVLGGEWHWSNRWFRSPLSYTGVWWISDQCWTMLINLVDHAIHIVVSDSTCDTRERAIAWLLCLWIPFEIFWKVLWFHPRYSFGFSVYLMKYMDKHSSWKKFHKYVVSKVPFIVHFWSIQKRSQVLL